MAISSSPKTCPENGVTLAIQAGGKSSRMGQNKALLPFLGEPLIARVLRLASPFAHQVILIANEPEPYRFLNLPTYPDVYPERGALGGLHSALHHAACPFVAVIACDMPFVSLALLRREWQILQQEGADAALPRRSGDNLEPLHALYRRAACLPAVQNALRAGQMRLVSWLGQVQARYLEENETSPYDLQGLAFWNLNTPGEFAEAEALARRLSLDE